MRRAAHSAVVLLLLALASRAHALPEETWVVAIGNNRGDSLDVQLLYAERDAREFGDVLRSAGHVASDRVRLLVDESAATVRRALQDVNAAIAAQRAASPQPTALVVFYSGHADASSLHLRGGPLAFDELRSLVQSSPVVTRLLIVDACRSGALTRVKGMHDGPEFSINLTEAVGAEGMAIISSSTAGESSQESDRLRASFFSHHLINALRGAADGNSDGRVTLSEAYAYTYEQTLRSSGRTLSLQHPTYAYDLKGSGDLVLTSFSEHGQSAGRIRLAEAGMYLITEAKESGAVVAELTSTRDRALISLPRGRYFVQQRGSDEYREYQADLLPERDVDLKALRYRSVRYDRLVRKGGGARRLVHGLTVLVGARGEFLAGEGPTANPLVGYSMDLPWFSVQLRLRATSVRSLAIDGALPRRRDEVALGLALQRFVDLPGLSVAFGLLFEGTYLQQSFDTTWRRAESRRSLGMSFGALFALERHLAKGLALRAEGGPLALLIERGAVENGVQVSTALGATATWWAAGGILWRH
jgi:hypothetical protein